MFSGATNFNQDIGDWKVGEVTNMSWMFYDTSIFDQDLSGWDVSNVTNMSVMFAMASSFNQDLSDWDVSGVTNMNGMFYEASSFKSTYTLNDLIANGWFLHQTIYDELLINIDYTGLSYTPPPPLVSNQNIDP